MWRNDNLPFEVQFFHPGLYYNRLVSVYIVDQSGVHLFPYHPQLFDFGKNDIADKIPDSFGFAGLRLQYPINRKDYRDEVAVFLGASYFRAVAKNQVYGLSARGLAVDTGLESGEEFPFFNSFWLLKPKPGADAITLFALLDSESLAGAYQFVITPGVHTQTEVMLTLFARKTVKTLGIVALTSMFFYGESTNLPPVDDFRPEIHDSDGLLLAYPSGEFVWRPLVNFKKLFINAFTMSDPSGFGLLQRDVNFDHYQDLEARYDNRPSTWAVPVGEWGPGRVELIQIPTKNEKNDNIVAFWRPDEPLAPGQPRSFHYRLDWFSAPDTAQHSFGVVTATRSAAVEGGNQREMIIDFAGGKLARLPAVLPADAPLDAVVTLQGDGDITEKQLYRNDPANGWRLTFRLKPKAEGVLERVLPTDDQPAPIEIRAYLRQAGEVLTETWSYAVHF